MRNGNFVDLTGKRFERWLVIEQVESNRKSRQSMWKCKCDCGKVSLVSATSLNSNRSKSCGCFKRDKVGLPDGEASFNRFYYSYIKGAKDRKLSFELEKDFFIEITSRNCFYCNSEPEKVEGTRKRNGLYAHNGIDRVDNSKGYTKDNVVPCCKNCNFGKRKMSQSEFYSWIIKVYNNLEFIT